MFDIGFSELIIVAIVGLLVIGPERLPGAIRTGSAWLSRIKRGYNDLKQEVQQELHNDAVMRELEKTRQQITAEAREVENQIGSIAAEADTEADSKTRADPVRDETSDSKPQ